MNGFILIDINRKISKIFRKPISRTFTLQDCCAERRRRQKKLGDKRVYTLVRRRRFQTAPRQYRFLHSCQLPFAFDALNVSQAAVLLHEGHIGTLSLSKWRRLTFVVDLCVCLPGCLQDRPPPPRPRPHARARMPGISGTGIPRPSQPGRHVARAACESLGEPIYYQS